MANTYFQRTFTTPTNNKIFTWSSWIKRSNLGTIQNILRTAGSPSSGFRFADASVDSNVWNTFLF